MKMNCYGPLWLYKQGSYNNFFLFFIFGYRQHTKNVCVLSCSADNTKKKEIKITMKWKIIKVTNLTARVFEFYWEYSYWNVFIIYFGCVPFYTFCTWNQFVTKNRASLLSITRFFIERIIVLHYCYFIASCCHYHRGWCCCWWMELCDILLAFSSSRIPSTMDCYYYYRFVVVSWQKRNRSPNRKFSPQQLHRRILRAHYNCTVKKYFLKKKIIIFSTSDLADKHCTNKTDYPKPSVL